MESKFTLLFYSCLDLGETVFLILALSLLEKKMMCKILHSFFINVKPRLITVFLVRVGTPSRPPTGRSDVVSF